MASNFLAGVYSNNIFSTQNPTPPQQQAQQAAATDLAGSGMDVVILASFHVHDDGSIFFNDTSAVSGGKSTGLLNPDLPDLLAQMQKAGITILASFGGGGSFHGHAVGEYDFNAITNLIAQYPNPADNPFFQNLAVLFQTYPAISGLDNDLESYSGYGQYQSTVDTLTKWLVSNGHVATIAPFDEPGFWAGVLTDSKDSSGNPTISWVNLQNASGTLGQFVPAFQGLWSDVPGHLLAGQQIDSGTSAQQVESCSPGSRSSSPACAAAGCGRTRPSPAAPRPTRPPLSRASPAAARARPRSRAWPAPATDPGIVRWMWAAEAFALRRPSFSAG